MKKVNVIKIFGKKYIIKFIDIPMSYFELLIQHNYVMYLKKSGILTPKIYFSKILSLFKIEMQEYIKNDNNYSLEQMIVEIAKFHNISYTYNGKYNKKKFYNLIYECNGVKLDKLLLGFKEKYYIYPSKNINKIELKRISKIYSYFYEEFITNFYNNDCIIHNDLTPNNIYFSKDKLCLIDFDLSINGSVYVDFVDIIMKRNENIYNTIDFLIKQKNIKKYIKIYNQNSINFKIKYEGCIIMIGLKLCAYNFFVLSNSSNKELYNNNIKSLESILEYLEGEYYDNKRSFYRRCKKDS